MKRSGDRGSFTAETLGRGDGSGDLVIGEAANIWNDLAIAHIAHTCHPERHRATKERGKVGGPRTSFLSHTASRSSYDNYAGLRWHLQNGWKTLRAVFREIFDESAYDRFLRRTALPQTRESYRAFMREREATIARKPRCC
jgi:hypothetical protein